MEQRSEAWLTFRKTGIGASDAPVIMGVSPWRTPYQLWADKMGIGTEQTVTHAMKRGIEQEEFIRERIATEYGVRLNPEVVVSKTYPWMFASLDGITEDGQMIVEIKTANKDDHATAKNGNIPDKYIPQVQHQMYVCDVQMCLYVSYHQRDLCVVVVNRDDVYIAELIKKETEFYQHMLTCTPPEFTDKDCFENTTDQWATLANEAQMLISQKRYIEDRLESIKNALIEMAGDRSMFGCGVRLTKTQSTGRIEYDAIPELKKIDLNAYRKPGGIVWKLTANIKK